MASADVNAWVISAIEAGHRPEQLLAQLQSAGWQEEQALDAIEQALKSRLASIESRVTRAAAVPEPNVAGSPAAIEADGHSSVVRLMMDKPRIVVLGQLLTNDECDAVIAQAKDRLETSRVVGDKFGENDLHPARVSDGMFFTRCETPLIEKIERRIAALLNWPVDRGEAIQVLRYGIGGKYDPHYDYFLDSQQSTVEATKVAGNRVGTLIMYLNTPTRGGGTVFPDVGLEVKAQRGDAVFFSYDRPDPATKTLHGGMPVLEGEKWIATKWLRERRFE